MIDVKCEGPLHELDGAREIPLLGSEIGAQEECGSRPRLGEQALGPLPLTAFDEERSAGDPDVVMARFVVEPTHDTIEEEAFLGGAAGPLESPHERGAARLLAQESLEVVGRCRSVVARREGLAVSARRRGVWSVRRGPVGGAVPAAE
ncbi:MAG: hypothetical protein FJ096_13995, partial [Deltaproteobacteria bacterium]|nr:hypothetical protein [Deltaproteobacteria bacterium]